MNYIKTEKNIFYINKKNCSNVLKPMLINSFAGNIQAALITSKSLNNFFDVIIEQTFFCALDPSLRNEYVRKCHQLLRKKGKVIGLLFNTNFNHNGPPYGGETDEYIALFSKMFNLLEMENSIHSVNPRKGNELWIEFEKK